MPPSNNILLNNANDYNAPMAFRRERYWFLSFMMTPFKDIDNRAMEEPGYVPCVRVAILTARNAPANERVITTLEGWGMSATETFFMGGIEKRRVLEQLKPHIFFDDQPAHLRTASSVVPSVHIPFGVTNQGVS